MATHYIENASSGNQYYFNTNQATTSQTHRTYTSPVTSTYGSSGHLTYPISTSSSYSPSQQIRLDDSYRIPQQYQSTAGFNKSVTQQRYQTPQSPAPQVRATVRTVSSSSQDQYNLPRSPQPTQISPQHHHFQFDSRQQPGRSTGPPVVYQTPGAAQYTHRNVDLWTESPSSQGQDYYVQAQRVSVRPVSTGSPQQSHSVSPQRHQDHLQQYYSQLTPEQHQQLLRQQQIQRQQEQNSYYEQQQRVPAQPQQVLPSSTYHQEQYRSTAGFGGGQQYQQVSPNQQQGRSQSELDRQRQNEQDYYAAQRQMAAQRAQQQQQQQEEQSSHPVGIRNLMSKFVGPAPIQTHQPRSRSTSSRQYSNTSYTTNYGPGQTTTRTLTSHSMTYSALPKPREPPVNSVEYYQMQMQQQGGNLFSNVQQAAAPPHIQQTPTSLSAVRDRFKSGSLSDDFNRPQVIKQQQPQPQQQTTNTGGSSLSSLRNQYMNQTKKSVQNELPAQEVQNISRTIIGEDIPQQKQKQQQASASQIPLQQQQSAPQASQQQQSAPQASQQQQSAPQASQQQLEPTPEASQQEQLQTQDENVEQQVPTSEDASLLTNDTTTVEAAASSN